MHPMPTPRGDGFVVMAALLLSGACLLEIIQDSDREGRIEPLAVIRIDGRVRDTSALLHDVNRGHRQRPDIAAVARRQVMTEFPVELPDFRRQLEPDPEYVRETALRVAQHFEAERIVRNGRRGVVRRLRKAALSSSTSFGPTRSSQDALKVSSSVCKDTCSSRGALPALNSCACGAREKDSIADSARVERKVALGACRVARAAPELFPIQP